MATSALQSLAQTSSSLYLNESTSGISVLENLHNQCGSAGLLSTSAGDDAERLYGIFNVALEHGLGSLVLDYVAQVSFGSGLHQNHPSSPVLSDPHCVAAWLQSSLAAARYDLSTALAQGLPSIASSQIAPRHVAKLQTLVMLAEALASKSFSTTGPAGTSSRAARRVLSNTSTNANPPRALGLHLSNSTLPETPSALVIEANRLLQTAKIMHWLSTQQLKQTNPSGRFASFSAWQGTVTRRKAGAGSTPLLLTDLLDSVMQCDVDVVSYPPPSPESLITNLFLSGNATPDAFEAKLALLCYCLVDANFLTAPDLVKSVHRLFHITPTVTCGWMLLLFLDDAQLIPADAPVNSSLNQAINSVPGVHGPTIPFRALRFFVDRGRGDIALGLLRQRSQKEVLATGNIDMACTALRVRLANGLLVESFIEMKRYLESTFPADGGSGGSGKDRASHQQQQQQQRGQHAQRLIEELLIWGSGIEGGLNSIISLSISPAYEEPALISWLQRSTHSIPSAGIILTLYFLMRGRTPEALLTYAQYGKLASSASAGVNDTGEDTSNFSLEEACRQVEELLRAACRMMPAAQRALVVGTAAEPALRFYGEDQDMNIDGEGGIALVSALPGLDSGGLPTLISLGPTAAEAPLVGGVMTAIARITTTTTTGLVGHGGRKEEKGGHGRGESLAMREIPSGSKNAPLPLLFGQTPADTGSIAIRSSTPLGTQFGAAFDFKTQIGQGAGTFATSAAGGRRQQHHQLDALLGVTPTSRTQATGTKGRRTLR